MRSANSTKYFGIGNWREMILTIQVSSTAKVY
jgi:hypothetical protein